MKGIVTKLNKGLFIVVVVLLLAVASIGGTLAWLTSRTVELDNTFSPGEVPNEVEEEPFDHDVKRNVKIRNKGDVDAYIRVALVPIWRESDGLTGSGLNADLDDQCTIVWGPDWEQYWEKTGDYYYYKHPVPAGEATEYLIVSCAVKTGLDDEYKDKRFELQVLSQSIQAEGMDEDSLTPQAAFARALESDAATP